MNLLPKTINFIFGGKFDWKRIADVPRNVAGIEEKIFGLTPEFIRSDLSRRRRNKFVIAGGENRPCSRSAQVIAARLEKIK